MLGISIVAACGVAVIWLFIHFAGKHDRKIAAEAAAQREEEQLARIAKYEALLALEPGSRLRCGEEYYEVTASVIIDEYGFVPKRRLTLDRGTDETWWLDLIIDSPPYYALYLMKQQDVPFTPPTEENHPDNIVVDGDRYSASGWYHSVRREEAPEGRVGLLEFFHFYSLDEPLKRLYLEKFPGEDGWVASIGEEISLSAIELVPAE